MEEADGKEVGGAEAEGTDAQRWSRGHRSRSSLRLSCPDA
jgi:hypothetical protein